MVLLVKNVAAIKRKYIQQTKRLNLEASALYDINYANNEHSKRF